MTIKIFAEKSVTTFLIEIDNDTGETVSQVQVGKYAKDLLKRLKGTKSVIPETERMVKNPSRREDRV